MIYLAICMFVPGVGLMTVSGGGIQGCNTPASGVVVSVTGLHSLGINQGCSVLLAFTAHDNILRNGTCLFLLESASCHLNVGNAIIVLYRHEDPTADLCNENMGDTNVDTEATLAAGIVLLSLSALFAVVAVVWEFLMQPSLTD